jgi:NAD(P)-dependent dehydrogenase (short-subunit alcohol dehydrogenase family)
LSTTLNLDLEGSVSVVTGASSGIGLEISHRLASAGSKVFMVARRVDILEKEVAKLQAQGFTAHAFVQDLAEANCAESIIREAVKTFGGVDCLVNDAAIVRHFKIENWNVEDFDSHVAINIRAPFFLIKEASPFLKKSKWASVVNISSSSGALHLDGQSIYGMSKAALNYLSTSLAGELAKDKIRINTVSPGPIDTPIHKTWSDDLDAAYKWLAEQVPLKFIGETSDIANEVLYLLSPLSRFITGSILPVDGGQVIRP